ncbi:pentapeptide repeat-containing protein [Legionella sp. WA2024007413]
MKNLKSQILKMSRHLHYLKVKELLYQVERFIPQLKELQNFFEVYSVLSDEILKSTHPFSYNMIHILLSLKKRIVNLEEFYKENDLILMITLGNELDEVQLRNHWTAFFSTCEELQTNMVNAFAKRLPNTDNNHHAEAIPHYEIDDELRQLLNQLRARISDLQLKTQQLFELVKDSEISAPQSAISSIPPTNEEHLFFSLPEEVKVSIFTHLDVEDLISAQLASTNLSNTAATAFAVRFKKNPSQVLAHLNEISPEEAYKFVEGYQHTAEYKALKSLVEHKMPMSDHEVACYMLTRHHQQLPDIEQLKRICASQHIDEKTRDQLLIIQNILESIPENQSDYSSTAAVEATALFDLFLKTFPQSYLNLLPFIHLSHVKWANADLSKAPLPHIDLSYADMSGINLFQTDLRYTNLSKSSLKAANMQHANLHHADLAQVCLDNALLEQANLSHADLGNATLRQSNLQQANLRWANLSGAILDGTIIDGADFSGTRLPYAQLINLDMRTIDLSQLHVEWSYLKKLRLVPDTALKDAEALEDFFNSFEKSLGSHMQESQIKWRIQMLKDLKRLINSSEDAPETKVLFLKKILAHYPSQTLSSTIFTQKHPLKHLFEQFQLIEVDNPMDEIDPSLQKEVISILDEWQHHLDPTTYADCRVTVQNLDTRFENCFAKVPGLTNVNQICQLSSNHFFLLQLFYLDCKYSKLRPYLINYPHRYLRVGEDYSRYASQIFNGDVFHIEQLQKIQPDELETYLYGDEDFLIKHCDHDLNKVKLGGLLITFAPGRKGICPAKVEMIDFQNKRLKFCFEIGHSPSIGSEIYLPIDLVNYQSTRYGFYLYPKNVAAIRAALALRASVTHYIFSTQKGPIPELAPITKIAPPLPKNEKTEVKTLNDEAKSPLLGNNHYGLYHRRTKKPCLMASEKMLCTLT